MVSWLEPELEPLVSELLPLPLWLEPELLLPPWLLEPVLLVELFMLPLVPPPILSLDLPVVSEVDCELEVPSLSDVPPRFSREAHPVMATRPASAVIAINFLMISPFMVCPSTSLLRKTTQSGLSPVIRRNFALSVSGAARCQIRSVLLALCGSINSGPGSSESRSGGGISSGLPPGNV